MTNEEKQPLLIDLCARLPFGVNVLVSSAHTTDPIRKKLDANLLFGLQKSVLTIKPYLRPMSSMTEEEREEYEMLQVYPGLKTNHTDLTDMYDWLNKKMFDYRGLIPMGLALEAPKDMYKTE